MRATLPYYKLTTRRRKLNIRPFKYDSPPNLSLNCFCCEVTLSLHMCNVHFPSDAMDKLGLRRYCCRRMLLSHVNLIDKLLNYAPLEKWETFSCSPWDMRKVHKTFHASLDKRTSESFFTVYLFIVSLKPAYKFWVFYRPKVLTFNFSIQNNRQSRRFYSIFLPHTSPNSSKIRPNLLHSSLHHVQHQWPDWDGCCPSPGSSQCGGPLQSDRQSQQPKTGRRLPPRVTP